MSISSTIENQTNGNKKYAYLMFIFPSHPSTSKPPSCATSTTADDRIRRAISAKERLIELLTEQRQAVIHRAVTRGLDPNVRLKDSGVEWLGDVPEHWDVRSGEIPPVQRGMALGT